MNDFFLKDIHLIYLNIDLTAILFPSQLKNLHRNKLLLWFQLWMKIQKWRNQWYKDYFNKGYMFHNSHFKLFIWIFSYDIFSSYYFPSPYQVFPPPPYPTNFMFFPSQKNKNDKNYPYKTKSIQITWTTFCFDQLLLTTFYILKYMQTFQLRGYNEQSEFLTPRQNYLCFFSLKVLVDFMQLKIFSWNDSLNCKCF